MGVGLGTGMRAGSGRGTCAGSGMGMPAGTHLRTECVWVWAYAWVPECEVGAGTLGSSKCKYKPIFSSINTDPNILILCLIYLDT